MGAAAGVGFVGGLMSGIGNRRQAKKQNQMASDLSHYYDPSSVNQRAQQLNPYLYGALAGQRGDTGYQNQLYNIAQNPGYIDPALMNQPYLQSAQRQQSDLNAAQGMLGRNQIGGGTGLGSAYALANQGARTARDTQLGGQYALWREQQKRQDLDWLSNQQQQAQGMAMNGIQGSTNILGQRQAPTSWMTIGGNAISSAMSGMGGMAGLAGGGGGGATSTGGWGQGMTLQPNAWQQSPYSNLQIQRG